MRPRAILRASAAGVLAVSAPWAPAFAAAPSKADWLALADCAAYYQVNARVADPDRPASMTAMVDETAQEYVAAAVARHRQETRGSAQAARSAVDARVKLRAAGVAGRSRTDVEKLIEACPQPDG